SLLLSLREIRPLVAHDPAQGLALLDREAVDLVIQDMNFTGDTTSGDEGTALFRAIRERRADLPVILLTAWARLQSRPGPVEARGRGAPREGGCRGLPRQARGRRPPARDRGEPAGARGIECRDAARADRPPRAPRGAGPPPRARRPRVRIGRHPAGARARVPG